MTTRIVEFCRFLGVLKHLKRTGWVRSGVPEAETIACHMYRMAVLSFLLNKEEVDRDKCIRMALVHDMAECIAGDITPHCGISAEEKQRREHEGMTKLASLVPQDIGKEFMDLWQEYELQSTKEAKAVKDLDKFDMIAQAYEYETELKSPGKLQEFFNSTSTSMFDTDTVKAWVQQLHADRNK